MHIKHLTFFVAAIGLLASCKKNSGSSASGNANKLKMYIENDHTIAGDLLDTLFVTYDNENRITSLASPILTFDYAYQSKSFTLDQYQSGQLMIHEIYYLGANNYFDSTFQYDNTNDTTTEGYYFNGSQLTSMITYDYSSYGTTIDMRDDYTYDNNGNPIKDVQSDGQGNVQMVYSFTYTTYPVNVTLSPTYKPEQPKYLPATQTLTDGFGNPQGTITYSYVFDSSKRLTKETDTADNGDVSVKTYVYE
jgi:hypothetical protein